LYCSIHAHPDLDYPYFWGGAEERGAGPGFGMNHNFPLPKGTGDSAYLETLETAIAQVQRFQPEFFLVSLGFDILQGDPAGGFDLSLPGLGEIARRISRLTHRGIPTILVQEGGYNLGNLGEYAVTFLQHFQDPKERNP
jgi:acetoin utilization deacetylase AcuC-like enzyme